MLMPLLSQRVIVQGWLDSIRELKGLAFMKLRDHTGLIQVVIDQPDLLQQMRTISLESVLEISGVVIRRGNDQFDPKSEQGDIEIQADALSVLNPATTLPFQISSKIPALKENEDLLARFRPLQLRRPEVQAVLRKRHEITWSARSYMHSRGFIEVETPILAKSTPEGARDFLIPSRRFKGKFYALPQSPQLFKQLCVIGGIDRYFQVARCFRDEDTRQDRLLEFTQLDIEMAFVGMDDVMELVEGLFASILKAAGLDVNLPLRRFEYDYLLRTYQSDKPDLRHKEGFGDQAAFWVTNFPLFEWSTEEGRHVSAHHPFTAPIDEHEKRVHTPERNLSELRSKAYDLVWNGVEVGGGSIRIHTSDLQRRIFDVLGLSREEQERKFGFLLQCLGLGAPPHGGLAIGLDRLIQILTNQRSVRDCVAFPYSQKGYSSMLDAPSDVDSTQLRELGIELLERQ